MFKQFTENIQGNQVYLLLSLCVFLLFFIIAFIMLIKLPKPHAEHMSGLPINDQIDDDSISISHEN